MSGSELGARVLDRLRAGTAGAHEAAERAFDWQVRFGSLAGYGATLARLHAFHAAWEPYLAAVLADPGFFDPRRRLSHLADDLRHLRQVPALLPRPELPVLATEAAALGSLYVLDGSRLGGRLIARHVAETLGLRPGEGLSYYGCHEAGSWRAFCDRLNTSVRPGADSDAALLAALATFRCFTDVVCGI